MDLLRQPDIEVVAVLEGAEQPEPDLMVGDLFLWLTGRKVLEAEEDGFSEVPFPEATEGSPSPTRLIRHLNDYFLDDGATITALTP